MPADEFALLRNVFGVEEQPAAPAIDNPRPYGKIFQVRECGRCGQPLRADAICPCDQPAEAPTYNQAEDYTQLSTGEIAFSATLDPSAMVEGMERAKAQLDRLVGRSCSLQVCIEDRAIKIYAIVNGVQILLGRGRTSEWRSTTILQVDGLHFDSLGLGRLKLATDAPAQWPILGGAFHGGKAKAGDQFIRDRDHTYHARNLITVDGDFIACYVREGLSEREIALLLADVVSGSPWRASLPPV
jgi:hypothetical protein